MNALRPILMLAVVVGACLLSSKFSEHHSGSNDKAFEFLYNHVVPAPLVAGGDAEDGHADAGHGDEHAAEGHDAVEHPLVAIPLPVFMGLFDGDRDHHNGVQLVLTNLQIFQIASVLLILIAFSGVTSYLKTGEGDRITRLLAGFCLYIRDEMVLPTLGKKDGARFLPFFLTIFFFILFMNLMGLVPTAATATASVYVTAGLALITLTAMIGLGMAAQGPLAFWKNLVPHVPGWLWPLMFVVELVGLFVKPFALTIRLFANMMGGHLVVLSFMGLIFFFAGVERNALGYVVSPIAVGFAGFIMIIEAFVAMLQAYIFTQLSIMFVGAAMHPDH